MRRAVATAMALALAALALSACQTAAEKKAAPPIRKLAEQKVPAAGKLPIVKSEPITADLEKALDNYRELLELKPDDDTRAESLRRSADLQVEVSDSKGNVDSTSLKMSIETYKQLLQDRPDDRNNDRVLYQLARAYQGNDQAELAIATLRLFINKYPTSGLIGDAHFRNAELLYNLNRYPEAETEYRLVIGFGKGAPFFESAQYKYGWSLFKQTKYDQALPVFFAILDRELPRGDLDDPDAALAAVDKNKADLAASSLRVCSLSFAAQGGGTAINDYFTRNGGEPRFYSLIYNALGNLFVEKRSYSESAAAYAAFIERHPLHRSAPKFQTRAIAAYQQSGFNDLVAREKERYVTAYEPGAAYWAGQPPSAEVMTELRKDFENLGRHFQAKAQGEKQATPEAGKPDFIAAAGWYRKVLDLFPNDPKLPDVNLLYADALFDGGQTADAAEQYLKTAYGYGDHPKASEAAYAAVQAWQRRATEVTATERAAALRKSADASVKLADGFAAHPQWAPVLSRAAEDLFEIKALDEAIVLADRLIKANPPPSPDIQRTALGIIADSHFAQARYPEAAIAYANLLKRIVPSSPQHKLVVEQLAASIYKQGEAARDAGELRAAAAAFLRVGSVAPEASIRPNADYDAASAYFALHDWPQAESTLENFRTRYPANPLIADVDKKLALTYQKDNEPAFAAAAYTRVTQRNTESNDTRREAAWLAATLYDDAKQSQQSAKAYEFYVTHFPQPLDRALQGRRQLADVTRANNDQGRYRYWLGELITADAGAGAQRSAASQQAAAQASLELALIAAAEARNLRLSLPIAKSLPKRKRATEVAIAALNQTAAYGFTDTTTAATYELGAVYRDFGRALLESERPRKLKAEELDQYNILIEEQADPFEQKAMQAHEANLQRLKQNLWNDSIAKSVAALAELAPAKYGKRELREDTYDALR